MHLISRRFHGVLDYLVGLLLIFMPKILGFDPSGMETKILHVLGAAALVYSVCTRYELGIVKVLSFRAHLALDVVHGLVLATSPWLFAFADRVWKPHVLLGLLEFAVIAMTRTAPSERRTSGPGTPARAR
jgi:hypothetical protein